jgi:hypothetical protein
MFELQIFTMISFFAFGYYAILIYRGMPNGNWRNLQYLIIDGKEILIHPASGLTTTTSRTPNPQSTYRPTGYVV